MTTCDALRDRLLAGGESDPTHLASCSDCCEFAARLEATRQGLAEHHAGVEPDAHFATRVAARLEETVVDPLAWAAWRFVPVALALLVVLLALRLNPPVAPELGPAPTEDVVAWLIGSDGETP